MTDSQVASLLRTTILNLVEKVNPVNSVETNEVNRLKLELELVKAKQHYQDSGQAILATTSLAMLAYLRGDGSVPTKVEYRDRFIDAATGNQINSTTGKSLTQLVEDAGLNPKSTKDRKLIKEILASNGWNYDRKEGWKSAAYLREFFVLPDKDYQKVLSIVMERLNSEYQQNLFVHQFQQKSLGSKDLNSLPQSDGK